jgi:AraC-like DNA-binding protein
MLETPSWALERETLLADWLGDVGDGTQTVDDPRRAARRDPALRRASELLRDELADNVRLDQVARAAGVSRHRLRGVAVAEVAQATGFSDQSHLHRLEHPPRDSDPVGELEAMRRHPCTRCETTVTLGMTPARYARLTAQTYKTHALS